MSETPSLGPRGQNRNAIKTCVFPIAGRKGAFQPATKSMPRELLPIIDRPMILLAVEEARAAGCERFIFVERPGAFQIRRYFQRDETLERDLEKIFGQGMAQSVRDATLPEDAMIFVEQPERRGLGHAIACAHEHVGDEPFAVLLPDDLVFAETPVLAQMTRQYARYEGAMLAGIEVKRTEVARYGIMRIDDTGGDVVSVAGLEEKPDTDLATSNFAITGRYILPPEIFEAIEATPYDGGGALQLTDAVARLVGKTSVWGFRYEGERFDCGGLSGYVRATIAQALARPALRDETLVYMRRMLDREASE